MSSADVEAHPQLIETISALRKRPQDVSYQEISEACNVSISWLTQFAANKIKDPSFNKVMRIRAFLATLNNKE